MALLSADIILSTSKLHLESSPVKNEYTLSFTVRLN